MPYGDGKTTCAVCGVLLTESNTTMKEHKLDEARLDSTGKKWCRKCMDEFDAIPQGE